MSRIRVLMAAAFASLVLAACVSTAAQSPRYDDVRPNHGHGGP